MRFTLNERVEKNYFSKVFEVVKTKYSKSEEQRSAQVQINPSDQNTPISVRMLTGDGYSFSTSDNKTSFTISNNTFTFQTGLPYSTWGNFFEQAWWAWKQCGLETKVGNLFWLSLRYINSFEVEGNADKIMEPSDYFKSYPQLPNAHQDYTRFLLQYTLPIEPPLTRVNVGIETRETMNNIFPIMFDLDTICNQNVPYNEVEAIKIFEKLRDYKNSVFFNNLTEKTLELFK
jgi:uncharacterized protein (TIGR04255 family)